jgi:hypothetical protein
MTQALRMFASDAVDLKLGSDGPNMLRSQRRLSPDLFHGVRATEKEGVTSTLSFMVTSSVTEADHHAPRRETRFRSAFEDFRPCGDAV